MKRFFHYGLFLTLLVGFALLAFAAARNFYEAHNTSAGNACINNLRQLNGATQQWILENEKVSTNIPSWSELKPYLGREAEGSLERFHCPQDRSKSYSNSYALGNSIVPPRCKIDPKHKLN